MLMHKMLTLLLLVIAGWYPADAQSLEAIDSIYLNALPGFACPGLPKIWRTSAARFGRA
jgi:hypothetical protein